MSDHLLIRTEDDEVSVWRYRSEDAAILAGMNNTLEYALERLDTEDCAELIEAYKERDWPRYKELWSVAVGGDVTYETLPVESGVETDPAPFGDAALTALLDKHDPIEEGSSPEKFMCECGETVYRGDSFYEDDDGMYCMDCGMDKQDEFGEDEEE